MIFIALIAFYYLLFVRSLLTSYISFRTVREIGARMCFFFSLSLVAS